jgi:biopolymer transport protein ExbD
LDLNGRPVAQAELADRLRRVAAERQAPRLLIQPAAGVAMQRAIDLLDIARAVGLERVRLIRGAGAPS